MSKLIFFTESYPYGKKESFIENEIEFLARKFDQIFILPKLSESGKQRTVPENCIVYPPMFHSSSDILCKGIFCFAPVFYFIKKFFSGRIYSSLYKTKKYISTAITCRAILSDKNFKHLNKISPDSTVYFYWGIGTAYVMPFIKNKNKKIVRFHGTDLYQNLRPQQYIPFRKEVFENLTQAVFISRQGMEYAQKTYKQYQFNACLSYLGTKDHGMCDTTKENSSIRLLSCSNVVPVKRVGLILKALLLIKDYNITWTHIGSGTDYDSLQKSIQNIPSNIKIHLLGACSNQQVIQYYQQNRVDLFINVSSSEGLPVSIMEAISFNIPVIATNVGGTSEIVTPESGLLLNSGFTSQELADCIVRCYKDRFKYRPRKVWSDKFNAEKNYTLFTNNIL